MPEADLQIAFSNVRLVPKGDPSARVNLHEPPQVARHAGWLKFNRIDRLEGAILGVSAEIKPDYECPEPGSASKISFFSWRDKENRVLILPILDLDRQMLPAPE